MLVHILLLEVLCHLSSHVLAPSIMYFFEETSVMLVGSGIIIISKILVGSCESGDLWRTARATTTSIEYLATADSVSKC